MPLYEYRCETCGAEEEKLEGFSAPPEHACEKCGAGSGMKRRISRTAFTLAGGGWHAQGYSGSAPEPKPAGSKAESKVESKAEKGPDAAPKGGCSRGCACH